MARLRRNQRMKGLDSMSAFTAALCIVDSRLLFSMSKAISVASEGQSRQKREGTQANCCWVLGNKQARMHGVASTFLQGAMSRSVC